MENGYGQVLVIISRVLKWIFERCEGTGKAVKTQIGYIPDTESIDISGSGKAGNKSSAVAFGG